MIDYLVIGGDSLIGSSIYSHLKLMGVNVRKTTRKNVRQDDDIHLNLLSPPGNFQAVKNVFLCAGVTNHNHCEMNPLETRLINVDLSSKLITAFYSAGSRVVYFSSNAVFNGEQYEQKVLSPTCPSNEYGRQKVEMERRILSLGERASIIRMTKIISNRTPLIYTWIQALSRGKAITAFGDLFLSPISLRYISSIVTDTRLQGIVHVSGDTQISYYGLASKLVNRLGYSNKMVSEVSYKDWDGKVIFSPKWTKLEMTETELKYGYKPQTVDKVIDEICQDLLIQDGA